MDKHKRTKKGASSAPSAKQPAEPPFDPLKEDDGLAWARRVAEAEDAGLD